MKKIRILASAALGLVTLSGISHGGTVYLSTNAGRDIVVGHTWLEFVNEHGDHGSVGFYPKSRGKLFAAGGAIGKFKFDDKDTLQWSVRWCYEAPEPIYNQLIACVYDQISGAQPLPKYQLTPFQEPGPGDNCTSWAANKLSSFGFNMPNCWDPQLEDLCPRGMLHNDFNNPPQGSEIQINSQFGTSVGPFPDYSLSLNPPELDPMGLIQLVLQNPSSFTGLTGLPVYQHNHATISADTSDILILQQLTQQTAQSPPILSGVVWGDSSFFDYTSGYKSTVFMALRDIYSHRFESPGDFEVSLVYMVENGAEIHRFTVEVSQEVPGVDVLDVFRVKIDPAVYPAVQVVPYEFGSATFPANMYD